MAFQKQYLKHLGREWRIVHAADRVEDGERILDVSLARGVDCIVHDKINMDTVRYEEFKEAVGNFDEWAALLDRRIGVEFGGYRGRQIIGYSPSSCPLAFQLDGTWSPNRRVYIP